MMTDKELKFKTDMYKKAKVLYNDIEFDVVQFLDFVNVKWKIEEGGRVPWNFFENGMPPIKPIIYKVKASDLELDLDDNQFHGCYSCGCPQDGACED